MKNLEQRLSQALKHFWQVRAAQQTRHSTKDTGNRSAATGGAQMDGFVELIRALLVESGLPEGAIHLRQTTLPGYFRPTKDWDLVVVSGGRLLASIEFKSQVGPSFGNNFNNRVEEALGSATDLWTAYREGAFKPSPRPWLGYLMLLESQPASLKSVRAHEPHFPVFEAFQGASYAKRYELFCERLLRERLYDASCLLLSDQQGGLQGLYEEPNAELAFKRLVVSLCSQVKTFMESE